MKDTQLLQYVHETAKMGILGLKDVAWRIEDSQLKQSVQSQIKEYQKISGQSAKMLRSKGETPKNPSRMARISANMMANMQMASNASASKIAEMVIKGNNMGIIKGNKHLNHYRGNDSQVRALAQKLLATEQANVNQMKPYL